MNLATILLLTASIVQFQPTPSSCNEGPLAEFEMIFPRQNFVLKPGKNQILLSTNSYLGLEQGGYQKIRLIDKTTKTAIEGGSLTLSALSSQPPKAILESPTLDFQNGHTYSISIIYAEAPVAMQCHLEHEIPVGSFRVAPPSKLGR